MSEIHKLASESKSTLHFLGLTLLTGGTYPFLWLIKNRGFFNSFSKSAVSETIIYLAAAFWSWQIIISQLGSDVRHTDESIANAVMIFSLALAVALIITIYIITKNVVEGMSDTLLKEDKIDMRINQFFAFIFGYFYINYKLNEVSTLRKRLSIMSQQIPQ